ncbi:MAG: PDDEXK nuclease domain-containing protein [Candidatus Binatia bacterium]
MKNDGLYQRIRSIWESSRIHAARSVNTAQVCANWLIGREIVLEEQGGEKRAGYGKRLIADLSLKLTRAYGRGFSDNNLEHFRAFFLRYPELLPIPHAARGKSPTPQIGIVILDELRQLPVPPEWVPGKLHPGLSWTHYRTLLRVEKPEAREFYEMEAIQAHWSARQLERQISSLYYERLLLSRNKRKMLTETRRKGSWEHPLEVIKDPYVLEFLNLPESHKLNETELETRLITHLQEFLLELGHSFAFIGRQQRLTLDGDHFYMDLVFYHVRLKCYVIIDLKTTKLSHADLGQMQLYVNYYDQEVAGAGDNPTLGLILCTDKNDAVVRYVLGKDQEKIFASRYRMELPTEAELAAEVRREMKAIGMGGE